MRLTLSFLLVFVLIGCRAIYDPTFMPAGYAYHGNLYKSPPGPEASDIGYPYSKEKNDELLQIWRIVAEDLVLQLLEEDGLGTQDVHIYPLPQQNAFNASFDHVLREVLREQGYMLASKESAAMHLWYEAHMPKDVTKKKSLSGESRDGAESLFYKSYQEFEEFVVILSIVKDGELPPRRVAGVYSLPTYGFETPESNYTGNLFKPVIGGER